MNEANDDLLNQCIELSKYIEPDIKAKINDWFQRNELKYAEDKISKGIKLSYTIEHVDRMIQSTSVVENRTDNEPSLNTDHRNDSKSRREFVIIHIQ